MKMRNYLVLLLGVCLFVATGCDGGSATVTPPKNTNRTVRPKLDPKIQTRSTGGQEVGGVKKADPPPLLD